jgi:hypothetical protein
MAQRQFPHLPDRLLIQLCDSFLSGSKAGAVARTVNEQLARMQRKDRVTRQQIYALLNDARQRRFFRVSAPRHVVLEQTIADLYRVDKNAITVADAVGKRTSEHLAEEAARLVVQLIKEVAARKGKKGKTEDREKTRRRKKAIDDPDTPKRVQVHIGLGAGFTTLNIARYLAHELRTLRDYPDLVLHALSPGFQVDRPSTSPLGFFGLFDNFGDRVTYVGLFSSTGVAASSYDKEIEQYPVSEAFERKKEIDIIITSLASAEDEHGNLNQFLLAQKGEKGKKGEDVGRLQRAKWIGDLQYRPFSREGDITKVQSKRAVTLFELDQLREFAADPGKHLLLVSGPCVDCEKTREAPMEALLSVAALKVWTHVIMDVSTGEKLADLARKRREQEGGDAERPARSPGTRQRRNTQRSPR